MKSDLYSITSLKKNIKVKEKKFEYENIKALSTTNLCEKKGKKYESYSVEKLGKLVKQLKIENKSLRKLNEFQENQIKSLVAELKKVKNRTEESGSQPISCMRTSNSVPKKNRVFFSKELVQVLDESAKKIKALRKGKLREDPVFMYNYNFKKVSRKEKQNESQSPEKNVEENDYYTPLSCSLQDKKGFSQTIGKDEGLKLSVKQKYYKKISRL